jgi:hypothetical protein
MPLFLAAFVLLPHELHFNRYAEVDAGTGIVAKV